MNLGIFTALRATAMKLSWNEFWVGLWEALWSDDTQYEYLGNGAGSLTSLRMIIIGLFVGLALAAFGGVFNKRVLGDFVRKLLGEACLSPEGAKTLAELDYFVNPFIRYSVAHGVNLRRVVRCREEEEYEAELAAKREEYEEQRKKDRSLPKFKSKPFRVNPNEHHFYIPEEMKYMAEVKFEKKGSTWTGAIVFTVVLLVLFVGILLALPSILEILDDWFGAIHSSVSSSNNVLT